MPGKEPRGSGATGMSPGTTMGAGGVSGCEGGAGRLDALGLSSAAPALGQVVPSTCSSRR